MIQNQVFTPGDWQKDVHKIYSSRNRSLTRVFLAGSIEMNKATLWQDKAIEFFNATDYECIILNPRRKDWDATLRQDKSEPKFVEQVQWELYALNASDIIIMWFEPGTLSPISLLEFGMFADSGKMVVGCPDGFWRKGNIDIVCDVYEIKVVDTFEKLLEAAIQFQPEDFRGG